MTVDQLKAKITEIDRAIFELEKTRILDVMSPTSEEGRLVFWRDNCIAALVKIRGY